MEMPEYQWRRFERGEAHQAVLVKWMCKACGAAIIEDAAAVQVRCRCGKWMEWEPAKDLESGVKR